MNEFLSRAKKYFSIDSHIFESKSFHANNDSIVNENELEAQVSRQWHNR